MRSTYQVLNRGCVLSGIERHGQRCAEIILRIGRKQVVPKERYKPKRMNVRMRKREFVAQEIQEGFGKEAAEAARP